MLAAKTSGVAVPKSLSMSVSTSGKYLVNWSNKFLGLQTVLNERQTNWGVGMIWMVWIVGNWNFEMPKQQKL